MLRMIPAAVVFAVATAVTMPSLAQSQAQPPATAAASTASGQPATQPTVTTPSVPAPGVSGATARAPRPPSTTSLADSEYGTAILLLERIQKVLDDAADGQTGTVKMDRGTLDELRAEVTQVRLALKGGKPSGS
jgi:hypothetical protein